MIAALSIALPAPASAAMAAIPLCSGGELYLPLSGDGEVPPRSDCAKACHSANQRRPKAARNA